MTMLDIVARLRPKHLADEPIAMAVVSNSEPTRRQAVTDFITANNALKSEAADEIVAARRDRDMARAALEHDRTRVIDAINAIGDEITRSAWLFGPGRGSYEWDDERYQLEFAAAMTRIEASAAKLRKIGADWSNCPTTDAEIQAARDPSIHPHPRWKPADASGRHPQLADEWDWRADGPQSGQKDRSLRRLNVASDYDDPRAPDQMAMVLRIDLIRVLGELTWRRAQVEMYQMKMGTPDYVYDPSDWEFTCEWGERSTLIDELRIGGIRKLSTLFNGPDKWAAHVVKTRDAAGDPDETEVEFFDTKLAAEAAVAVPHGH